VATQDRSLTLLPASLKLRRTGRWSYAGQGELCRVSDLTVGSGGEVMDFNDHVAADCCESLFELVEPGFMIKVKESIYLRHVA